MKQILGALVLIIIVSSLITFGFTYWQVLNDEQNLQLDLQYRTTVLAESLKETVEPYYNNNSLEFLNDLIIRFTDEERVASIIVFDNDENHIASSTKVFQSSEKLQEIAADAMDADKAGGSFTKQDNRSLYIFALPLHNEESVVGALIITQRADYINAQLGQIWRFNLIRLFLRTIIIVAVIILIANWIIFNPMKNLVKTLQSARMENVSRTNLKVPKLPLLQPLVNEVFRMSLSLKQARLAAQEEAKRNLEKLDAPWTAERLQEFIKVILKDRKFFIVSNREPYIHTKSRGRVKVWQPASGMVTALEPIMQACGGMWIAHGSGDADKDVVDNKNTVHVPPDDPKYTLKRVWLSKEEEEGYYYGFANEGLWPLCHIAHTRPSFVKEDWMAYQKVNEKFAKAVLSEINNIKHPIILVQDFHFSLLPKLIKAERPDALVAIFWHIPWPNSEAFRICPWRKELLTGLLGADLIGFHIQLHCNNFIDTVNRELESLIDWERFSVSKDDHTTYVKPFPISIGFTNTSSPVMEKEELKERSLSLKDKYGLKSQFIGIGVDRLDYTKGIIERFQAVERFFEKYPKYTGKFTFIEIAAPTRSKIERYDEFSKEVNQEAERINKKYRREDWQPILLINKHMVHEEIFPFYRLADVCLVTSLHDGMNLVAKEFISSRDDKQGVLVLSEFTGASRELKSALIINPYDTDQIADAIKKALDMPPTEKKKRMKQLRETVRNYNVYRWSAELLRAMSQLE